MMKRTRAACGCTFRVVGAPPEVVMDVSGCLYPALKNENQQFHAMAAAYGEQGVVLQARNLDEKMKLNFIEGPTCPECRGHKGIPRVVAGRSVYVMAWDYEAAHQPRSPEDVPKKLCCVRCGHLRALPATVNDANK
jgi:hypothetical protein